ncbi:MAG: alpha/beta fold hydrolase [Bacteroidales bacterium]
MRITGKAIFALTTLSCLLLIEPVFPQPSGEWIGHISARNQKLYFEFDFDKGRHGQMDIPEQNAFGLKIDTVISKEKSVRVIVDSTQLNLQFNGNYHHKDSIKGSYTQPGILGRFTLYRKKEVQEDVSWINREVRFKNDTIRIAGTLSLPDTTDKHPAVIFISGSGQHTRDVNIYGFEVFKKLAVPFIEAGFAVLRYDDRGAGETDPGNLKTADTRDFAKDTRAAFQFLEQHPHIQAENIGLLGHSEGGMIAPMVAKEQKPAFIILMAAPAVPGDQILISQTKATMKANNIWQENINEAVNKNTIIYNELKKSEPDSSMVYEKLFETIAKQSTFIDSAKTSRQTKQQMEMLMSPWFKFFIRYDPRPALEKLEIPVLALYGGKDVQIVKNVNKPVLDSLAQQKKQNITVKVFPDANHLFQKSKSGSVQEYHKLPDKFINDFTEYIVGWSRKAIDQ